MSLVHSYRYTGWEIFELKKYIFMRSLWLS